MVEISYLVLLIPYGICVALFLIFALVNLYHLFAFGFLSFASFLVTFLFLAGSILILFTTYKLGADLNWTQTFVINFFQ